MSFPLINPFQQFLDTSGDPLVNGTIEFRDPTSNALIDSFPTADDADAQANANDNPLTLNASGAAPGGLFLEDGVTYKVIIKDAAGDTVVTYDDVLCPIEYTQEQIGTALWPISNSESDASVTPTSYSYPPSYIERYGGVADGTTDSTTALETANSVGRQDIKFYDTGRTDQLSTYTGRARFYIIRDAYIDRSSLIGTANFASDGTQTESMLRLGQDIDQPNGSQWRYKKIEDITFSGKTRADNAISFGADNNYPETMALAWEINRCFFERCNIGIKKEHGNFGNHISYCSFSNGNYGYWAQGYPIRSTLSGAEATSQTVLSVTNTTGVSVNDVVRVEMDDDTVHKSTVTAVTSTTVTIADATDADAAAGNYIKFYHPDDAVSTTLSHVGSDYIEGGEFSGNRKAAIYIDGQNASGTGQTVLQNVIIEQNPGFGIFVKDYNNAYTALTLKNVWFETNGKDATSGYVGAVDLGDGFGTREPQDIYFENVDNSYIMGSQMRLCTFIDSSVHIDHCTFESSLTELIVTNTNDLSRIRITNAHIAAFGEELIGADSVEFESISRIDRELGDSVARCWRIPQLTPTKGFEVAGGKVVETDRGDGGEDWIGVDADPDVSKDGFVSGLSYETASQYTFLDGDDYLAPSTLAMLSADVTAGKWYVLTMEIKVDSGLANIGAIKWGGGFNMTRGEADSLLTEGEWATIGIVGKLATGNTGNIRPQITINTGGGSDNATVTIGASQAIQFDDAQDAYEFYNKNIHIDQKRDSIRVKKAPTSRDTDVTLTDDPDLKGWNLQEDTNYKVEGVVALDTDGTADFQFLFDFSNAAQSILISTLATGTPGSFGYLQASTSAITVQGETSDQSLVFNGVFKTNATTGGDVAFQWAQGTSNAYSTTLKEGSWLRISKLVDET